jgi:Legionella pneumophila major outer membrane protein precursor
MMLPRKVPCRWPEGAAVIVTVLAGFAGLASASDPARLGPPQPATADLNAPAQDAPAKTPDRPPGDAEKKAEPIPPPRKLATPAGAPASPPPEGLWQGLMDEQQAYLRKLGPPNVPEADPRAEADWHVFAESGFVMVHSYFGSNPAAILNQRLGTAAGAPSITQLPNFDYTVNFGPRVVLGAETAAGLGVRGGWWLLDESATTGFIASTDPTLQHTVSSIPVLGVPGFTSPGPVAQADKIFLDQLVFNNHLQLDVYDLEVFKEFASSSWSLLLAGGARYAYLSQGYAAFRFNSGTSKSGTTTITLTEDSSTVGSGHSFDGVGPTGALEVRRRLGNTGLAFYGMARGSVLCGRDRVESVQVTVENAKTTTGSTSKTTASTTVVGGSDASDGTVPVGDFEMGLSWTRDEGRTRWLVQAGLVNQTWFGVGSATRGGDVGFYGLRLTAGVNY